MRALETFWQDLRYGVRLLRLSPVFGCVAVLSLALGIGANTAIFQLLDAVRLKTLPIRDPQQLAEVRIAGGNHGMGINSGAYGQLTRPIWQEIRARQQAFSGMFAWAAQGVRVGESGELRVASALTVSGDFFPVLGIQPFRGRLLLPDDETTCPASKAVVSYSYWQREMGGRDLAPGNRLMVDGELKEVVGVTPPGFFGLAVGETFDIAQTFCLPKDLRRDLFEITVMGRLRPGWTVDRATTELGALSPAIFSATTLTGYSSKTIENYKRFTLAAYPASSGVSWLRATYDSSLWLLLAITGLVLIIACANLANLLLARASAREREVAIRLALGASRGRLVRQLLAESALLACAGATIGVGVAQILSRLLVWSLSTESGSVHLPLTTDWRVLLFAASAGTLTCLIFGAAPAWRSTNSEPVAAMKAGGRGLTAGRERFSLQRVMVVTQIAVSLVLLAGAVLFVRSFRNLLTLDPGMREKGITVAFVGFEKSGVTPEHYDSFTRELVEEARSAPGITDVASTTMVPLLGGSWTHGIHVGSSEGWSKFTWVSPDYFRTLGITLLNGRGFDWNDTAVSKHVAVVNQTFIRLYLGGSNPVGRTLRTVAEPDYPSTEYEIVGVVKDTKYEDIRGATPPMTFAPSPQWPLKGRWTALMIRSDLPPAATIRAVKERVGAKHPEMFLEFSDFQRRIRDGMVRERLMALLSGFFGILAVLLATVGLYGVISYLVTRRRNEIGIRMALGAQRGEVVGMVLRDAGIMLLAGVLIGSALSLLAGRAVSSLLFGLKPYDPATLAVACATLGAAAMCASFLPALRASRLDPMEALRYE